MPHTGSVIESRLNLLLAERRMKISDLARLSGVSYQTLWRLYHDTTERADFATLNAICSALGVEVGDILRYTPDGES
jgi:putative transcriptional regulator